LAEKERSASYIKEWTKRGPGQWAAGVGSRKQDEAELKEQHGVYGGHKKKERGSQTKMETTSGMLE